MLKPRHVDPAENTTCVHTTAHTAPSHRNGWGCPLRLLSPLTNARSRPCSPQTNTPRPPPLLPPKMMKPNETDSKLPKNNNTQVPGIRHADLRADPPEAAGAHPGAGLGLVRQGRERGRGGDTSRQPRRGQRCRGVRGQGGGRQQLSRERYVALQASFAGCFFFFFYARSDCRWLCL